MSQIMLVVIASLAIAFTCSLCEAALYSVTPARVEMLRRRGDSNGRKLGELRDRIDGAIAGIATVNTIAQTVGAIWAGAIVGANYGVMWLSAFSAAYTIAILFFTEIVPKSIGVAWSRVLAVRLAWLIQGMIWLIWPVATLCTLVMERIKRTAPRQEPCEEEIMLMTELAAKGGTILKDESRLVKNVLRLNDVTARQLMTPRSAIEALSADMTLGGAEAQARQWVHSRIPVFDGDAIDGVVGVVRRRVVFDQLVQGASGTKLRDLMQPALCVAETTRGHVLLETLIEKRQHIALVTADGEAKVIGLVSLEDLLEYLLGREIIGEHDTLPEMERMARERKRFHAFPVSEDARTASDASAKVTPDEPHYK